MDIIHSRASMVRGADGRLYSISASGVAEVAEAGRFPTSASLRAGDSANFDTVDHEAGRTFVNPGC